MCSIIILSFNDNPIFVCTIFITCALGTIFSSTDIYMCLRTGLHSQIPARSLAIASVTNVTLVVTESDTYDVINIGGGGATMG